MSRSLPLVLLFLAASPTLAQNSSPVAAPASTTPVQIVYLVEGTTIVTYNVDTQTLNAIQVGTPVTVPNASTLGTLIPAPHGHFLYLLGYDANSNEYLWVYGTDDNGAPKAPAAQRISIDHFFGFQIDPRARFAYAVFGYPIGQTYNSAFYIRRYAIDPVTGALSSSEAEAKYVLPNGAEGTTYCYVQLYGFNPGATTLYDAVGCVGHDGETITYNERSVNSQSGALGSDVQIYSWTNGNEGYENVHFVDNLMFDFVTPNGFQQGVDSVNIYPIQPNTSQPLVQCTASMLEACGYSGGVVHPSAKYVFMAITGDTTQIDRVELSHKKIVDTGNYIPYSVGQFSPDGTLVYAGSPESSGYEIEIYGFDVATGNVTPGGAIPVPSNLDPFYVAVRN